MPYRAVSSVKQKVFYKSLEGLFLQSLIKGTSRPWKESFGQAHLGRVKEKFQEEGAFCWCVLPQKWSAPKGVEKLRKVGESCWYVVREGCIRFSFAITRPLF